MSRPNSWMLTLAQLMRSESFIIAGTTLDEIDFTYYVEQRSDKFSRTDIAPSILIEPFPDLVTEKLCSRNDLVLFQGTVVDFFQIIESKFGAPPQTTNIHFDEVLNNSIIDRHDKIAFTTSFELVPKATISPAKMEPFLLGAEANWGTLEARADIPREITPSMLDLIRASVHSSEPRVLLILDEPGSGKSAFLKRLSFQLAKIERNVYFFNGQEILDEENCAKIIDSINGFVFIFVDNWSDHSSFFVQVLGNLGKRDVILIGAERKYRRSYIENALADEEFNIIDSQLNLDTREARRLIVKLDEVGLSSIGVADEKELKKNARLLNGELISVASCRIQNNFYTFDRIIRHLMEETSEQEKTIYASVGLSRMCYSGGIQRSALYSAHGSSLVDNMTNIYSKFPITNSPLGRNFFVPARPVIADRLISILQHTNINLLTEIIISLADALAPYVNRSQIAARAPAAKLAAGLLDFDRTIRRFINSNAEHFYDSLHASWSWNSRYWEQCALMKLDRFQVNSSNHRLLEEAIQNARHAYAIEKHPLSLTTLAKMLFSTLDASQYAHDDLFNEVWDLIVRSIEIESRWINIKATSFVVCFVGVLKYVRAGGRLDGRKVEKLRDIIATTHSRRLRDRHLTNLRDQIAAEVLSA